MRRRLSVVFGLATLLVSPAAGFDSYWHALSVQKAGENFGFTTFAWKIMQLGNFSPDFFGPVSEYQLSGFAALEVAALHQQADNPQVRVSALRQSERRTQEQLAIRCTLHPPAAE
jgi:hypothetical protein